MTLAAGAPSNKAFRPAKLRKGNSVKRRQARWAYVFLSPAILLFLLTVIYPMLRSLQYSFFKWPLGNAKKTFLGFDNYKKLLFDDDLFHTSVKNTLHFTILTVIPTIAIALGLALLLNSKRLRGRGVFRTIYFIPVVTSLVAVSFVWRWLLEPTFGLVNTALGWIGIDGPGWLADPSWALQGVMGMTIWRDVGYYMVIFLAGLQTIPKEIHEAASIDGANAWQRFRRVTFPLLNPSIVLAAIIGVIYGLQLFTQVYVMTGTPSKLPGGPLNSTTSVVLFIVQQAFRPLEMGYSSAAAILLFFLIMIVTLVQLKVVQRKFEY
ncbi:MAG: sugar ABC transporter permease [Ilumatobacteraceae bacterium]